MSKIHIYVYENKKKNKSLFKTVAFLGLFHGLHVNEGYLKTQFNNILSFKNNSRYKVITFAYHKGIPIACITLEKHDIFYEISFFVKEEYRRLGLAKAMLQETIFLTGIKKHFIYSRSSMTEEGYKFLAKMKIYSFEDKPMYVGKDLDKLSTSELRHYFRKKFKQLFKIS